jgi:hypothetical protein
VFPNPHNPPAESAQFTGDFAVALTVASDLLVPKFPVRFRAAITAGATVPKTAVHKDSQPVPPKKKIRFTENILIPPPAGDVVLTE